MHKIGTSRIRLLTPSVWLLRWNVLSLQNNGVTDSADVVVKCASKMQQKVGQKFRHRSALNHPWASQPVVSGLQISTPSPPPRGCIL